MTVEELIKELELLDRDSKVVIVDGHHFMREAQLERVEKYPDEYSSAWPTPMKVRLIGREPSRR